MPINSRPIPTIRRLPTAFESGREYKPGWRRIRERAAVPVGVVFVLAGLAIARVAL